MGEDEVAIIRALSAYREVMTMFIQQHQSRVVDSPSDNFLVEFAIAVDAAQWTAGIQATFKAANTSLPPNRRMEFRIGINADDAIVEGERQSVRTHNSGYLRKDLLCRRLALFACAVG